MGWKWPFASGTSSQKPAAPQEAVPQNTRPCGRSSAAPTAGRGGQVGVRRQEAPCLRAAVGSRTAWRRAQWTCEVWEPPWKWMPCRGPGAAATGAATGPRSAYNGALLRASARWTLYRSRNAQRDKALCVPAFPASLSQGLQSAGRLSAPQLPASGPDCFTARTSRPFTPPRSAPVAVIWTRTASFTPEIGHWSRAQPFSLRPTPPTATPHSLVLYRDGFCGRDH